MSWIFPKTWATANTIPTLSMTDSAVFSIKHVHITHCGERDFDFMIQP